LVESKTDCDILQLALLVVKHLVEEFLIFVDLVAHLSNPTVVFVLEAVNDQQHLLALEAALVFFLLGRALVTHLFGIGSALG
jgi:hypothetical protein